jgi:integrase
MPLTNIEIKNAQPKDTDYTLSDGSGLFIIIRPGGSKLWRFRYRREGKLRRLSLGSYPDITLETLTGHYLLVFPGRNDASKPMSEGSINKVLKLIGYHGKATGHGFRHTMSTILHEQGFDSVWIEMQLAHADKNSIRDTYNHAQYIESRKK